MTRRAISFVLPSEAYRIDDFMTAANGLGVDVVVATDAHHALAEDMGATLVPIDFADPADAAMRLAGASATLDAIVAVDDRGIEIAAAASELRGLPHNRPNAVHATRNKAAGRVQLQDLVAQPASVAIGPADEMPRVPLPVVVKPTGLAGSVGVIRVDSASQLGRTIEIVRDIQTHHGFPWDQPVLIEEFIPGDELAIEGLITDGSWDTLAVFDKPDPLNGPYFAETHYVTPSRHSDADIVAALAADAAATLGLVQGPVHAEFRVGAQGPVLLELAARPIGGLCGRALRFGLADTALEELIVRNALGERVRGTRLAPGASGVSMIPVPIAGVFRGIEGVDAAEAIDHITSVEVSAIMGKGVRPLPYESTYLGFVFARAETPDEVELALRSAVNRLEVALD